MWKVERLVYHDFIPICVCVKLGAMKFTPSDPLHQEYLTITIGRTGDWRQPKMPLVRLFGRWRGRCWPAGAAWGRECRRRISVLPLNLSDTAVTSQDGSSLEFIAPIAGRQCYIQDASGRGLWSPSLSRESRTSAKTDPPPFYRRDCSLPSLLSSSTWSGSLQQPRNQHSC